MSHNQIDDSTTLNTGELSNEQTTTKPFFINNDKFELLKTVQRQIFEITEFTPTIRKLVNELITLENLETIKRAFIKSLTL